MNKAVLGNKNEKIIVFYTYKDQRELDKFRVAIDQLINPKVLQSTVFVIFVGNEVEKNNLPDVNRFKYIAKKDFNLFGAIKDKEIKQAVNATFDTLFVFGMIKDQDLKLVNKVNAKQRIVTNSTERLKFDISLNANATGIEQIANFAREMLEKIRP